MSDVKTVDPPAACTTCGFNQGHFSSAEATCPNCGSVCGEEQPILKLVAEYEIIGNPGKIYECEVAGGPKPFGFSQFSGRAKGVSTSRELGAIEVTLPVWLPQARTPAEAFQLLPEAAQAVEPTMRIRLTAAAETRARTIRPATEQDVPPSPILEG